MMNEILILIAAITMGVVGFLAGMNVGRNEAHEELLKVLNQVDVILSKIGDEDQE